MLKRVSILLMFAICSLAYGVAPLEDFHDVLVVGGTVKGVEAAIAARDQAGLVPARVQLLTPYPYLGEDMAGTLELGFGEPAPTGGLRRTMWENATDHAAFDYWETPKCTHPQFVYRNDRLERLSEPSNPPSDGDTVYHYGDVHVKCVLKKESAISTVEVIVLEGKERHGDPGATLSVTGEFLDGPRKGEKVEFVRREAGFDVGSLTVKPVSFIANVGSKVREFGVTVKKDPSMKCQYLSRVWFHLAGAERQVGVPSPLKVKRVLDRALIDAGVDFMTSTAIEDVIRGRDGKIVGVVAVNRSGRRTYRAKKVIDATRYGLLEGFGRPFRVGGKERFSRVVIVGGDNPPRAPGMSVEKLDWEVNLSHAARKSATAYRCTMEILMADGSFASFAAAERRFRAVTWNRDVLDDADLLVWHRGDPPSPRGFGAMKVPPVPSARYDVVVVGGGTSGTPAAIAAARAGAKVLIVEYLNVLGGVGTDGMICGYYDGNHCGFTDEFKARTASIKSIGGYYPRSETWRRMCEEAGVEVWFGAMGVGALKDGAKVTGVRVGTEHGPVEVRATCVIDATGNCDIAAAAGAATEFIGADEFALQSAGQAPHRFARGGINSDFGYLDDSNANDLWLFMLRARAGAPNAWDIAKMPDSRERRRIISDHFLSAQDVSANRPFPDTVVQPLSRQDAHGYIRDIYAYVAPDSGTMKDGLSGRRRVQFSVNVPLRSLLPKGLSGIAVIGVGAGVERDVQPIIRMQADLMNMGYSVGVAAAMAAANGGDFRAIDHAALKARLVEKGILRREVLDWTADTDVSSDTVVAAAVASLKDDFKGADVIWRAENRARALPGLRAAYRAATDGKTRQIYAEMLGMLGDATGVETLAGIVSGKIPVQATRHGANFGEGNNGGDNMRGFMIALGRTRDPRALEPLLTHLRALTPRAPLGEVRSATLALGELGDPGAAELLAAKLREEGNHGFAVADWRTLKPQGGYGECPEMVACLRELAYARALLLCGDFEGLARKTFTAYAQDPRGVLSAYAKAVLKRAADPFGDWPKGKDPETIARKVSDLFLTTVPDVYKPTGYSSPSGYCAQGYGRSHLHYSVVSLWINLMDLARLYGDEARLQRLVAEFEPFYGPKKDKLMTVKHVDFNIVGAVPLEIAIMTGDARARTLGLWYADRQWEKPQTNDIVQLWGELLPFEERMDWWRRGYTDQSRMWIDDMYMITVLQSQAYRLTGDRKYIDRAAKEMCVYLDRLQIKEGPDAGLFHHGPDAPFVWGRGAGWMAAGMPLLLKYLPADSEYRAPIMAGYLRMMKALKARQCASGMWNQLVGDAESWEEPSATAMFGYAFIEGVKQGWLDASAYGEPARRAYLAVVERMDEHGNVRDVCAGTPKKNDRRHYLERPHVHGDPHAQAPLMWMCRALLD